MTAQRAQSVYISKQLLYLIVYAITITVVMSIVDPTSVNGHIESWIVVVGWLSNLTLAYGIYQIYKMSHNVFDYNIIFSVILFLFSNGSVFLSSFGIWDTYLFHVASMNEILDAAVFFLKGFVWFQVGQFIIITKHKCYDNSIPRINSKACKNAIAICGVIFFSISIIPFTLNYTTVVIQSFYYGYGSLFTDVNVATNGLSAYLTKYFIPSIFLVIYSNKDNRLIRNCFVCLLFLISFGYLFSGNRGMGVTIVISYMVYYYNFEKDFSWKEFRKLFVPVMLLLILIPAIFAFRQISERDVNSLFIEVSKVLFSENDNFIVKTISELGGSMYPFILTKRIIPTTYHFKFGESYLASIMMLIPSFFMGGYSFASKAALDTWLQKTLHLYAGAGYSLFAETYYNFGSLGVFFCGFLGLFFTFFLTKKEVKTDMDIVHNFLKLVFLYLSMTVARYPFHGTLRNLIYINGLLLLVIYYIYRHNTGRTKQ